jgi:hypothetical protein
MIKANFSIIQKNVISLEGLQLETAAITTRASFIVLRLLSLRFPYFILF